jgi:hypothetical protein
MMTPAELQQKVIDAAYRWVHAVGRAFGTPPLGLLYTKAAQENKAFVAALRELTESNSKAHDLLREFAISGIEYRAMDYAVMQVDYDIIDEARKLLGLPALRELTESKAPPSA